MPAPANNSSANNTTARWLRQKAINDFNMATYGQYCLVARRRQKDIVEKDRTVCYNKLSRLQTLQNLDLSIFEHAYFDMPLDEMLSIGCDPGCHRAVAFTNDAVRRDFRGRYRFCDFNLHAHKHAGTQFVIGIVHFPANGYAMEIWIHRRINFCDRSGK